MNGANRLTMQKVPTNRHGGKAKEIPSSSREEESPTDTETFINNLPLIKIVENAKLLTRYSAVLGRMDEDAVNMDDLDQLQLDFERLLTTAALRNRFLRSEIEIIDKVEERRDKKGKNEKGLKRKRPDEKPRHSKDPKSTSRPIKRHYPLPHLLGDVPQHEVPRINLPKNDTSDKFWATVEPYCSPVTTSHAQFLDKLIEECSLEMNVKVPELGDYYASEWAENAVGAEQDMGLGGQKGGEFKKNGLSSMVDTFSNPITQRLLAALIEEKVMTSFPSVTGKLKPSDLNIIKGATGGPRAAICMDRRLKKDLVEQGLLSVEELSKTLPDDEILQEIKKCQQELATVNEFNVEELKRLRNIVSRDLKRQEIKSALDKVDSQVLELYNKVLLTKQKQVQQAKDEDLEEPAFTKMLKEFELQADILLKQQFKLQKDLSELHEVSN